MNSSSGNEGSNAKLRYGVTYAVLVEINNGLYAKQIAIELKRSKTSISRQIQKLIEKRFIEEELRSSCKIYTITQRGKTAIKNRSLHKVSYIPTIKLGTHLSIKIPITKHGRIKSWNTVNDKFRNSIIRHKDLSSYIDGVSIKEGNKSLTIYIKHRKLNTLKQTIPLVTSSMIWAMGFFMANGYELDYENYCVNDIHSTVWTKEVGQVAEEGGKFTVAFPWDRKKITPRDPGQQARAWTDGTPEWNVESNDIDYMEKFLMMPVKVARIEQNMDKLGASLDMFAKQIEAHLGAYESIKVMAESNSRMMNKMIPMFNQVKKTQKVLLQRKLSEYEH